MADDFLTKPFDADCMRARLRMAQQHVPRLEGLLPICMYCKKIRDAAAAWTPIEAYVRDRSAATFSHGICPEYHG